MSYVDETLQRVIAQNPYEPEFHQAVKEVLGVECWCGGVGGSTVAVSFRELGIPAAVWAHIFENCHTPNEAARLSFAVGDAQVYASMLFND